MLVRAGDIPTITITNKTNPKIAELYQKLQDKSAEIAGIESERLGALEENATAMYEKEQSLENKTLTATTTATTGLGAMGATSAYAERLADADAEEKMSAYITTMRCEYGGGTQVNLGKQETLPGGNELANYYAEYKQLAETLKATKKALNLRPGIESEILYDRAESGIYRYQTAEQQSGAYTSLSRALMNPEGEDAAKIATQKQENSKKLKTGLVAAGGGIVAGIIGNYEINKDAPKESSDKINQEYDDKVSKINKEKTDIETELVAAIDENRQRVQEYNQKVRQLQESRNEIQNAHTDCRELFGDYIGAVDNLELIENETDVVPDVIMPEMDSDLLAKCTQCKNKDAVFYAETKTCECPADRPIEKDGKCVGKPVEVAPVVETPVDDKVVSEEKDEKEETPVVSDDPNICAVGLKHTAGFGIVAGQTRVGDRCTSALVLDGTVFKRKNGTCGCSARICETRNGRAAIAEGGVCVCDKEKGYKDEKGKCVKSTDESKTGTPESAEPESKKEYKYYNCGDTRQLPKQIIDNKSCEYVSNFSGHKVTPMEADGLMKEWALEKYKDAIECDEKSHRIQSDGEKYRQCVSTGKKEKYYEFVFKSLDAGNEDFFSALCSIWGLKYGKSDDRAYYTCKNTDASTCKKISASVKRTFFPGGEAILENSKCVIKVHESAQSSRYQINAKAVTVDKLKTTYGIDPRHFYDKTLQINASSALYREIQNYLFNDLRLGVKPMQCFSGIVDNALVIPMTTDEYEAQRKKQNECVSQNNTAMMGSTWGGGGAGAHDCMKKYPIPEEMSDILTCEYDGKRFDLTFKKLDVKWNRKSTAGYQGLRCLSEGGSFTGKSCALANKEKCDSFNARFKKDYPNSKGMEWDEEIGACVLKDAKYVSNVQKVAETTGMVALTLVTAVTGGPVVWALAVVEGAALVTEAVTEEKINDWAERFLVDAAKCDSSSCADTTLKKHIARVIAGSKQFSETQEKQIARQMQRLMEMLDVNIVTQIIEGGNTAGFIGDSRDPDLEKSIRKYYDTQLTANEKALLAAKKISTVLTFATLIGAGVTAGLRQAVKHNWLKLSEARQAKWVKWKILKPDDVAGLAPKATDAGTDAARAMTRAEGKRIQEIDARIAELEKKTNRTADEAAELTKLRQERNTILNKVGTKDADEVAKLSAAAYNPEIEKAQSEYQKLLKEREALAKRIGTDKAPGKVELQTMDKQVAAAEKKLKDLGADIEPVDPLWKADGNVTTSKKAEPKQAEPKTAPKEPETVAPKSEPAPKATGGDPYTNMDPRIKAKIDQIKTEGGELGVARKNLTDDQWKALKEDLAKDGVEVKEQGSAMFVIKKPTVTSTPAKMTVSELAKKNTKTIIDEAKNLSPTQRSELYSTLTPAQRNSIAKMKVDSKTVTLPFGSNIDDLAKNPDLLDITGNYLPLNQKALAKAAEPEMQRFTVLRNKLAHQQELERTQRELIAAQRKGTLSAEEAKRLESVNKELSDGAKLTKNEVAEYNKLMNDLDPIQTEIRHITSSDISVDAIIANGTQYKEKLLNIISSDPSLRRQAQNFDKLSKTQTENFMNQVVKKLDVSFGVDTKTRIKYVDSWVEIGGDAEMDARALGFADSDKKIIYMLNDSPVDLGYGNKLDNTMAVVAHEHGHIMDGSYAEKVAVGGNQFGHKFGVSNTDTWEDYAEYLMGATERSSRGINEVVGTNFTKDLNATIKSGKVTTSPISDIEKLKIQSGLTGNTFVPSSKQTNGLGVDFYKFTPPVERPGSLQQMVDNMKELGVEHVAVIKEDGKEVVAIFDNADDYNAAMRKLNTQAPKGAPKATANVENSVGVSNTGRGALDGASSADNTAKKTGDVADAARNSDKADNVADVVAEVESPAFRRATSILNSETDYIGAVRDQQLTDFAMDYLDDASKATTEAMEKSAWLKYHQKVVDYLATKFDRAKALRIASQRRQIYMSIIANDKNLSDKALKWKNLSAGKKQDFMQTLVDRFSQIHCNGHSCNVNVTWSGVGGETRYAEGGNITISLNSGHVHDASHKLINISPNTSLDDAMTALAHEHAHSIVLNAPAQSSIDERFTRIAIMHGEDEKGVTSTEIFGRKLVSKNGNYQKLLTEQEGFLVGENVGKNFERDLRLMLSDDVARMSGKVGGTNGVLLDPNELVRVVGNEGKVINGDYISASRDARKYLNDVIDSGKYTRSADDYIETMNNMHRVSANGANGNLNWYADAGQGGMDVNPGKIRGKGRPRNSRGAQAQKVEQVAKQYGDPFRVANTSTVNLPGIPKGNLPINQNLGGTFYHWYPDGGDALRPYYEQMYRTSKEALDLIKRNASERTILEKIAEHYQYAANARPYGQINNSLFMNEVNSLLQRAGLRTMPHGELDIAAMHLQPNTFKKYFIDTYYKTRL